MSMVHPQLVQYSFSLPKSKAYNGRAPIEQKEPRVYQKRAVRLAYRKCPADSGSPSLICTFLHHAHIKRYKALETHATFSEVDLCSL